MKQQTFADASFEQYWKPTRTTISQQQYEMALQRVREAGSSDRIAVLLMDYRTLPELASRFDKLVSIEMIKAVGLNITERFSRSAVGC